MKWRGRFLTGLAELLCRRPWWFIAGGVGLAMAASLSAALHLGFKTSRNDLIGRDSEYWRLYSEYAREFPDEDDYILAVEGNDPARNRMVIDALAQALVAPVNNPHPADAAAAQSFLATDVFARVNFEALQRRFLYFLSVEELGEIRDSLQDFRQLIAVLEAKPELATFFDAMNQMLEQMANATPAEQQRMASFLPTVTAIVRQMNEFRSDAGATTLLSPWAGAFFSQEMLAEAEQQMQWQGYHAFAKGRMFLLLVHPRAAAADGVVPHEATIAKLRRIIGETRTQFPDVQIGLTGESVLDQDEMTQSRRDATWATILTLVVIAILFAFSFHEILRPVLASACLLLIIGLSLGWATLAVGHLNLITITFTVMIVGLGIDLGIQIIARYEEELSRGAAHGDALVQAIGKTGTGIVTAALTNAAAFLAMALSGFRGVIELGVIAAGGMVLALLVMLLVLPPLMVVVRRRRDSGHIPAQAVGHRFSELLQQHPSWVITGCVMVTVGALAVGWRVDFDHNVLNLQSRGLESVAVEKRLLSTDAQSTIYAAVVCDSLAETRRLHALLEQRTNVVVSVSSIAPLLPERQDEKVAIIRQIQQQLGHPQLVAKPESVAIKPLADSVRTLQVRARGLARDLSDPKLTQPLAGLTNALAQTRAILAVDAPDLVARLTQYQQRFYADLQAQLQMMADQEVEHPMTLDNVPPEIRRMLVNAAGTRYLLRVFPRENIWERAPLLRFVREVKAVAPQATGTPLGIYEFIAVLKRGYVSAALWALAVIAVLILLDFRSVSAAVLTLLPLLVGTVWMVGAMVVLGIPFNPANIMTLPLIVGIGVAYGIYVVQRYREDRDTRFFGKSTGRAVVLSALTTIVGFGSLMIGRHQGIFTLGLVMSIGITACLLTSLTLLPALLEICRRRGWKV